jgi:BirA family biotin operon repressor/biotin-[acetyl-CoA-carboxylase] ligase
VSKAGSPAAVPATIVRLGHVPSTQAVAFELAERGAPDRTVVLADHQTAGRGRRGRRWEDEPGASLLVSIVVRPRLEPGRLALLSYAAALAVAETLAGVAGLQPRLKWPNDVLVGGGKIAGILLESRPGASGGSLVVLGVGLNLTQRRFAPPLAGRATSVALAAGRAVDRETLLEALLERFEAWRRRLEGEGFEPVRARWLALSDTVGRRVSVDGQTGQAVDLDAEGALILETAGGRRRVVAGEVTDA